MSATVREIYDIALTLIDENGSEELEKRAPGIVTALSGRCFSASEEYETGPHSLFAPADSMDSEVYGIDNTLALSAMPFGLAAIYALDYDPAKSRSLWGIFLEHTENARHTPEKSKAIGDEYGGIGFSRFGRW